MIITQRFLLRPLTKSDVSSSYLSWLKPEISSYIEYTQNHTSLKELLNYVSERENRHDVLFLGIFTKDKQHIGNIKYEPINYKKKTAVMGILIGDSNWRGRGVATEVIKESGNYLANQYGIKAISLGVNQNNKAGVVAYKKVGFKIKHQDKNDIQMIWKL